MSSYTFRPTSTFYPLTKIETLQLRMFLEVFNKIQPAPPPRIKDADHKIKLTKIGLNCTALLTIVARKHNITEERLTAKRTRGTIAEVQAKADFTHIAYHHIYPNKAYIGRFLGKSAKGNSATNTIDNYLFKKPSKYFAEIKKSYDEMAISE